MTGRISKLDEIFAGMVKNRQIHELVAYAENSDASFSWHASYGGKHLHSALLMASTTKLFTTACILKLCDSGKLSMNDNISLFLSEGDIRGLHCDHGRDYSADLTIADLLFQKSGLPDYYLEGKEPLLNRVIKNDMSYSFQDIAEATRKLKPHFKPGSAGKAYYADINFDLLSKIIENSTDRPLAAAFHQMIFEPLELKQTYLPLSEQNPVPALYYGEEKIERPLFIRSCGGSGGCVSTAYELMIFLKAFWHGRLFNMDRFSELNQPRKLQLSLYPIKYAGGFMHIRAGYPLGGKIELMGHTGSTGSFALYAPSLDLFLTGDTNQIKRPDFPVRFALRLALACSRTHL